MDGKQNQRPLILAPNSPETRSLNLDTREGNPIQNTQSYEISAWDKAQYSDLKKSYGNTVTERSEPTAIFNCHGLTFASRRTCIYETSEVEKILRDDGYKEVPLEKVLPGDVIIYRSQDGDPEHSGIVVQSPQENQLKVPLVVSKWGKYNELLHFANQSPYTYSNARYYRIQE